jgi:Zn-dependent peptidase ImmA (M78 family)
MLLKFARALGVRVEYFFRTEQIDLEEIEYRKHPKLPVSVEKQIQGEIREQLERQFALNRLLPGSLPAFTLPDDLPKRVSSLEAIEQVADKLRQDWKLGENPIPDLMGTLEDHGIIVLLVKYDSKQFDGLSSQAGGLPMIAVGHDWPGDRQRFTLAHELGHLVLKNRLAKSMDEEKACNRFAGAFLAPATSVKKALGQNRTWLEPRELLILKQEYGLSMAGWLFRAWQTGVINKTQFSKLNGFFRKHGWQKQEPGADYPREQPRRFEQQVYHALAEDLISESKAAELLGKPLLTLHAERMETADEAAD